MTIETNTWGTVDAPATLKVDADCICRWCPQCEFMTWANDDDTCDECSTNLDETSCTNCGEIIVDLLDEMLGTWIDRNGNPDAIAIAGTGMGWLSSNGSTNIDAADNVGATLVERFGFLDGDMRMEFVLSGTELTARRWSHDEPMGSARFVFRPLFACATCGDAMDETHDNLRPTWSDEHDDIVCWWCATESTRV